MTLPAAITRELSAHLDTWAAPGSDGYVFTGDKGGPVSEQVLHHRWTAARRSLGLEHVHFHDLRHVAGTLAASTGAGTKELMHRLGHASPAAALRYQHATSERDEAIAAAMDGVIASAMGEQPRRGRRPAHQAQELDLDVDV